MCFGASFNVFKVPRTLQKAQWSPCPWRCWTGSRLRPNYLFVCLLIADSVYLICTACGIHKACPCLTKAGQKSLGTCAPFVSRSKPDFQRLSAVRTCRVNRVPVLSGSTLSKHLSQIGFGPLLGSHLDGKGNAHPQFVPNVTVIFCSR